MDKLEQDRTGAPDNTPTEGTGSQLSLWSSGPADSEPPAQPSGQPALDAAAPWSLADVGAFILFAVISFFLANLAAILVFLALQRQFAWELTLEEALTRTPFVVLMQTGWEMLWLLFIYLIITVKYRRRFWEAIKWLRGPHPMAAYLIAGVLLALAAQILFSLFPSEKQLPIERLFSSPASAYLLAVFGICIAPFVEELVFRGFFYPVFERLWGLTPAVLLTASLFASIHVPQLRGGWQEIAAIFFVGAAFSYCRGKTGSLLPPYLMHLTYNAFLFVGLYFSTDRFQTLQG
ncbi:MAG: CPBP family intramembrane metalloprotease [Acidobacteria bacterium]|nr:CPBP family intramembrane metalloprotease [Acidobacteriota bacterium]